MWQVPREHRREAAGWAPRRQPRGPPPRRRLGAGDRSRPARGESASARDPLRRRRPPDAAQGETPGRGHRGFRGLDTDGRPRSADWAGPGARRAPAGRSGQEPGVLVVPPAEEIRPALGEKDGLATRRHRPLPPRGARSPRTGPGRRRRPLSAPPPGNVRPHRPPASARGAGCFPRRRFARGLREGRRSPARLAPLRRTLGPALARRGPLRRVERQDEFQLSPGLAISGLGDRLIQRRQALRPVRPRADRRRPPPRRRRSGAGRTAHRDRLPRPSAARPTTPRTAGSSSWTLSTSRSRRPRAPSLA